MIDRFMYSERPVTEPELAHFETCYGVRIPESFRRFMAGPGNGGRPTPQDTFDVPTRRHNEQDSIGEFKSLTPKPNGEVSTLEQSFRSLKDRIPDDAIPLASCGCGDTLIIFWTGPFEGQVWIWDHDGEGEGDNLYFVAASFDELLDSLYDGECDE